MTTNIGKCSISGCGDAAHTVYYGLMLCETCYEAAVEAVESCRGETLTLERVLLEFVMPSNPDDEHADKGLDTLTRIHRALRRRGLPTPADRAAGLAG